MGKMNVEGLGCRLVCGEDECVEGLGCRLVCGEDEC